MILVKTSVTSELSLMDRVRKLLSDVNSSLEDPGDFEARTRWQDAHRRIRAQKDLEEIEDRLEKLKRFFPELEGVEAGPLVGRARELFASSPPHFRARGRFE